MIWWRVWSPPRHAFGPAGFHCSHYVLRHATRISRRDHFIVFIKLTPTCRVKLWRFKRRDARIMLETIMKMLNAKASCELDDKQRFDDLPGRVVKLVCTLVLNLMIAESNPLRSVCWYLPNLKSHLLIII